MAKQRNVREPKSKTRPRGRPPSHQETWSKVSVVLFDRQIVHLDRLATDIRGKSGKVLNRAGLIRALIDALIDSGLDITTSAFGNGRASASGPTAGHSVPLSGRIVAFR